MLNNNNTKEYWYNYTTTLHTLLYCNSVTASIRMWWQVLQIKPNRTNNFIGVEIFMYVSAYILVLLYYYMRINILFIRPLLFGYKQIPKSWFISQEKWIEAPLYICNNRESLDGWIFVTLAHKNLPNEFGWNLTWITVCNSTLSTFYPIKMYDSPGIDLF